jgi:hypothetical protein
MQCVGRAALLYCIDIMAGRVLSSKQFFDAISPFAYLYQAVPDFQNGLFGFWFLNSLLAAVLAELLKKKKSQY